MFNRTRLSVAVSAAFSAGLVGFAPSAMAQATPAAPAQSLERVEVTGSLIKRIEGETRRCRSLRSVLTSLQKAGVTNAEQAVKFITQNQSRHGDARARSAAPTARRLTRICARLGPSRTLVLLNGKRVVSNPFAIVAVDLNTLPLCRACNASKRCRTARQPPTARMRSPA